MSFTQLQKRMIGQGALIMLIGMSAGIGLLVSLLGGIELIPGTIISFGIPGESDGWVRAHIGGMLNGMLIFIVALMLGGLQFDEAGCRRLHLVDLNGAFEGQPVNGEVVTAIARRYPDLPIQIGGGIRTLETIEHYVRAGVSYVIIGTKAVKQPEFVTEAGGKGKVEAFTVIYRGNGEIEHGVTMLRTEDDRRTLGRIPASDKKTLAHLLDMDRTPVGTLGDIVTAEDGMLEWRVG